MGGQCEERFGEVEGSGDRGIEGIETGGADGSETGSVTKKKENKIADRYRC